MSLIFLCFLLFYHSIIWVLLLYALGPFKLLFSLKQLWSIYCHSLSYVFFHAGFFACPCVLCPFPCDGYLCVWVMLVFVCVECFHLGSWADNVSRVLTCSVQHCNAFLHYLRPVYFLSGLGISPVFLDFCSLKACWRVQSLWKDLGQCFPEIAEVFDAGVNSSFLWDDFRSSSRHVSLFSTGSVHPHIHPFLLSSSNHFHFSLVRERLRPQPNSPSLLHSRLESFGEKPQDSAASLMWVGQVG